MLSIKQHTHRPAGGGGGGWWREWVEGVGGGELSYYTKAVQLAVSSPGKPKPRWKRGLTMSRIFLSLSGAGSWGLAAETWVVKYTTELLTMPSDVLRALAEHKVTKRIKSKTETHKKLKRTLV